MKIRNRFVSNSSSSSFIIIGAKVSTDHEIFTEEFLLKMYNHSELKFYEIDSFYCFGETLTSVDEDGMIEARAIDIPEASDILEKIQKYFPDITREDIKIFCGTYAC